MHYFVGKSLKMIHTSPQNGGPIFSWPLRNWVSGETLHLQDFHLQGLRWFLPQVSIAIENAPFEDVSDPWN